MCCCVSLGEFSCCFGTALSRCCAPSQYIVSLQGLKFLFPSSITAQHQMQIWVRELGFGEPPVCSEPGLKISPSVATPCGCRLFQVSPSLSINPGRSVVMNRAIVHLLLSECRCIAPSNHFMTQYAFKVRTVKKINVCMKSTEEDWDTLGYEALLQQFVLNVSLLSIFYCRFPGRGIGLLGDEPIQRWFKFME